MLDRRYPLQLNRGQPIAPVLFVRGEVHADEVGVSVVGSRDASPRGQQIAGDIARGLVGRGIAVISGLANGIDTAAHRATLAAGGRPIGVLGTGITRVYPETNRALHQRVAAAGALVSQFWPEHPPDKHTLALRNATIAGLSRASVIVEAGERSGSQVHAPLRAGLPPAADPDRSGRRIDPVGTRNGVPAGSLRGRWHCRGVAHCRSSGG